MSRPLLWRFLDPASSDWMRGRLENIREPRGKAAPHRLPPSDPFDRYDDPKQDDMKKSILASLMLALTLASSAAPRLNRCDASKCKTTCCKVACCDASCCASANGKVAKTATNGKAMRFVKQSHKSASCCDMPCCNGGACCSSAACCK